MKLGTPWSYNAKYDPLTGNMNLVVEGTMPTTFTMWNPYGEDGEETEDFDEQC